jgi:hypothetical protein
MKRQIGTYWSTAKRRPPIAGLIFMALCFGLTLFLMSNLSRNLFLFDTTINLSVDPIDDTDDKDHSKFYGRLADNQRVLCGNVCAYDKATRMGDMNKPVTVSLLNERLERSSVDCMALFATKAELTFDGSALEYPPSKTLPSAFVKDCTLDGIVPIRPSYMLTPSIKSAYDKWTKVYVDSIIARLKSGEKVYGGYGYEVTKLLYETIKRSGFEGKSVLVVGSEKPWVEGICLAAGAARVTTLEYRQIRNEHPQIDTLVPKQFNELFRTGKLEQFDAVVTFSSLEHSGLGRYGDGFNCWGDIIATARLSCVVKVGGKAVLGLPAKPSEGDAVLYNERRSYGAVRLPLVLRNWRTISYEMHPSPWYHAVIIAENVRLQGLL